MNDEIISLNSKEVAEYLAGLIMSQHPSMSVYAEDDDGWEVKDEKRRNFRHCVCCYVIPGAWIIDDGKNSTLDFTDEKFIIEAINSPGFIKRIHEEKDDYER